MTLSLTLKMTNIVATNYFQTETKGYSSGPSPRNVKKTHSKEIIINEIIYIPNKNVTEKLPTDADAKLRQKPPEQSDDMRNKT